MSDYAEISRRYCELQQQYVDLQQYSNEVMRKTDENIAEVEKRLRMLNLYFPLMTSREIESFNLLGALATNLDGYVNEAISIQSKNVKRQSGAKTAAMYKRKLKKCVHAGSGESPYRDILLAARRTAQKEWYAETLKVAEMLCIQGDQLESYELRMVMEMFWSAPSFQNSRPSIFDAGEDANTDVPQSVKVEILEDLRKAVSAGAFDSPDLRHPHVLKVLKFLLDDMSYDSL